MALHPAEVLTLLKPHSFSRIYPQISSPDLATLPEGHTYPPILELQFVFAAIITFYRNPQHLHISKLPESQKPRLKPQLLTDEGLQVARRHSWDSLILCKIIDQKALKEKSTAEEPIHFRTVSQSRLSNFDTFGCIAIPDTRRPFLCCRAERAGR